MLRNEEFWKTQRAYLDYVTRYERKLNHLSTSWPWEVAWCSHHSPPQMFWNFLLLKSQSWLTKYFSLAGNWLTQKLLKKKQNQNQQPTLYFFWSTVAILLLKMYSPYLSFHCSFFSPRHQPFCQPQNWFSLSHYNLLEERSIFNKSFYFLSHSYDSHHLENALNPEDSHFSVYTLVISSPFFSLFITLIIQNIIILKFPPLLVPLWFLSKAFHCFCWLNIQCTHNTVR